MLLEVRDHRIIQNLIPSSTTELLLFGNQSTGLVDPIKSHHHQIGQDPAKTPGDHTLNELKHLTFDRQILLDLFPRCDLEDLRPP